MTPQAVASAAKAIAPQTTPAQAPVAGTFDFGQLLNSGFMSLLQAGNNNAPPQPPAPHINPPRSTRSDTDSATSNLAAAANVTAPQQPAQAPAPTTTQASTQTPPPSAVGPAMAVPNALVPASALPAGSGNANSGTNGNAGQGAQTAPGAAEVEARVAAGAPTYLSQPNTMLAGLWHHGGPAQANDATQDGDTASDGTAAGDASASDASTASTDASAAKPAWTSLPDEAAAAAHGASDGDAGTHAPDAVPGQAIATAATSDPTGAAIPTPSVGGHEVAVTQSAAQTNATATALPTPVHVLPAAEQVALSLRQAVQSGTDRIEIQLKPASLGAIAVKLDVTHDGHVSAVISADRSDTLNLLKQDSAGLQQSLRDAGLKSDSGSLSFNLRGGDSNAYSQNASPSMTTQRYADAASTPSSSQSTTQPYLRRHDGTLDIEV